ncbi:MAG: preprotein translocase subunit SecE [Proteobacteria bacterium]|nr:preprotein translocase subunit SecE [Pseudomonadota bacterium]
MARISPGQYVRQVRQEVSKVVWPTRRETLITTGMVLVMVVAAALFFMAVDFVFSELIQLILPGRS